MRPLHTNAHFACVPGRPISAPLRLRDRAAASLAERAEDLRFFAAHHVRHLAALAARPARCAASTPRAAFTVTMPAHERIGARRRVDVRRFHPALRAADHAGRDHRQRRHARSSHAPQVSSNACVEAALLRARQIHDARRRCARVEHRAVGVEQIGAQRVVPQSSAIERGAAACATRGVTDAVNPSSSLDPAGCRLRRAPAEFFRDRARFALHDRNQFFHALERHVRNRARHRQRRHDRARRIAHRRRDAADRRFVFFEVEREAALRVVASCAA